MNRLVSEIHGQNDALKYLLILTNDYLSNQNIFNKMNVLVQKMTLRMLTVML